MRKQTMFMGDIDDRTETSAYNYYVSDWRRNLSYDRPYLEESVDHKSKPGDELAQILTLAP